MPSSLILTVLIVIVALAVIPGLLGRRKSKPKKGAIMTFDTPQACLDRIRDAWDAGDAATYARQFTADATYVIFLGDAILGCAEIERTHVDVFGRWQKGTRMAIDIVQLTELSPDVVVVLTAGGISKTEPIVRDKFQTYTLVRQDGAWLCAAFQNTEMSDRARKT